MGITLISALHSIMGCDTRKQRECSARGQVCHPDSGRCVESIGQSRQPSFVRCPPQKIAMCAQTNRLCNPYTGRCVMPHTAPGMTAQRLHNRRQAPSAPPAATVPNSSGLTRLQMELNTVSRNRNELRQRFNNTTSSLETMRQSSLEREQDLETLKSQLQRALEEQTTTTQSLRSQYEMVPKSNLEAKEQELKNAENHLAQVIQGYEADISSLKQQLGNAVKNGANKQQAFNMFTDEVKAIASNRNAAREELERVRGQMAKFADEVEARVKHTLAARFETEKQITSNRNAARRELAEVKAAMANVNRERTQTITELTTELQSLQESRRQQEGMSTRRSTSLQEQVTGLESQLRAQQVEYAKLVNEMEVKDQNLAKRQQNIRNRNTLIARLESQLGNQTRNQTQDQSRTNRNQRILSPPSMPPPVQLMSNQSTSMQTPSAQGESSYAWTAARAGGRGLLTAGAVLGNSIVKGGQFVARQLAAQPFSSSSVVTNGQLESQVSGTYQPQPRNQGGAQAQTQVPSQFNFRQGKKMMTVYAPMTNGKFACKGKNLFLAVKRDNTGTIEGRRCLTEAQVGKGAYTYYNTLAKSNANYMGAYALTDYPRP